MSSPNQNPSQKKSQKNTFNSERLDQLVNVIQPQGWIVLSCILLFLFVLLLWSLFGEIITTVQAPCIIYPASGGPISLASQSEGHVIKINIDSQNEPLASDTPILTLRDENGKIITIKTPIAGKIISYSISPGELLTRGMPYATFLPYTADQRLIAQVFIPPMSGKLVREGMQTRIAFTQAKAADYGYLLGTVSSVSTYPKTQSKLMNILQNDLLVSMMSEQGPPYSAEVSLTPDPNNPKQYAWTRSSSNALQIDTGSLCTAYFVTVKKAPISLLIPLNMND